MFSFIITQALVFVLSNIPLVMLLVACFIGIFCLQDKSQLSSGLNTSLGYFFLLTIGLCGMWGFIMHAFFPQIASGYIGWQTSPFEFEVAVANLGLGIGGVMAYRHNDSFRLAVLVISSVFFWGAAAGHLYQMHYLHNNRPGNAGTIFYTDILIPALIWVLYLAKHYREKKLPA